MATRSSRRRGSRPTQTGVRRVTAEERRLWERVMRDAEPISRRLSESPPGGAERPQTQPPTPPADKPRSRPTAAAKSPQQSEPAGAAAPAGVRAALAGLDKRSTQRLRRGLLPIEAELDLHGYTEAAAQQALTLFLMRAQAQGKRCVLVITGKGTVGGSAGEGLPGDGRVGVLREQVPRWLKEPSNCARVIAWHPAQPKDGGEGALYVLLRRERG